MTSDASEPLKIGPAGTLDGIAGQGRLVGWLWQPGSSGRLTAEILDGPRLVGRIKADLFRQDLLDAGVGDGRHGFSLPLPPSLHDGRFHTLRLRPAGGDGPVDGECRVVLQRRSARLGSLPTATAILRHAVGQEEVDREERIRAVTDATARLALRFGDPTTISLLYLYCLGREADSGGLETGLRHLAASRGDYTPVVAAVLSSEEFAAYYGTDPLASMPPIEALTIWLGVAAQ